jgi:hypothetical protein
LHAVLGDYLTLFNDTERLVIDLADALTDTPSNVSDELYARLRNQFSEEQLMQLGAQSRSKTIAHDGTEFSTSKAMICTRRKQTNRKTHDPPECGSDTADAVPATCQSRATSKSISWT